MRKSTTLFLFPDVNVWLALTYRRHVHYTLAKAWLSSVPDDSELCFCRLTQLGFLRLPTTSAVMGNEVLSQEAAWEVF
jgi:predicted nucleic acid-binding protein